MVAGAEMLMSDLLITFQSKSHSYVPGDLYPDFIAFKRTIIGVGQKRDNKINLA